MFTIDDFKKLDIRIGQVKSVESVSGSEKLLKFVFDFGTEERQIIAGIAHSFPDITALVGKQMPVLTNIEPAMLMGHESQGMILAADAGDSVVLLQPASEVVAGSRVR